MKLIRIVIKNRSNGHSLEVIGEFVRDHTDPKYLRLRASSLDFGQWSEDSAKRLAKSGTYIAEIENSR